MVSVESLKRHFSVFEGVRQGVPPCVWVGPGTGVYGRTWVLKALGPRVVRGLNNVQEWELVLGFGNPPVSRCLVG